MNLRKDHYCLIDWLIHWLMILTIRLSVVFRLSSVARLCSSLCSWHNTTTVNSYHPCEVGRAACVCPCMKSTSLSLRPHIGAILFVVFATAIFNTLYYIIQLLLHARTHAPEETLVRSLVRLSLLAVCFVCVCVASDKTKQQLPTVDLLARASMKNAASCDM